VTEPLHLSFDVRCTPAIAFATWTKHTSTWWPPEHSVTGEPGLQIVFEGSVGGRIFERTASGVEHEWGRVTAWEPPTRLAYIWHLSFQPEDAMDVEVRFVDAGDNCTHVVIEHSGWERLGERAAPRREGNRIGWNSVIPHFVETIEKGDT
jgi:uncharacterized protein YndB with AHSA1/START domain